MSWFGWAGPRCGGRETRAGGDSGDEDVGGPPPAAEDSPAPSRSWRWWRSKPAQQPTTTDQDPFDQQSDRGGGGTRPAASGAAGSGKGGQVPGNGVVYWPRSARRPAPGGGGGGGEGSQSWNSVTDWLDSTQGGEGWAEPSRLRVESEDQADVAGVYELMPFTLNGHAVWGCRDMQLYSTRKGYWMVADAARTADDVGVLCGSHRHGGAPPHAQDGWDRFVGPAAGGDGWARSPTTAVRDATPGGGGGGRRPRGADGAGGDISQRWGDGSGHGAAGVSMRAACFAIDAFLRTHAPAEARDPQRGAALLTEVTRRGRALDDVLAEMCERAGLPPSEAAGWRGPHYPGVVAYRLDAFYHRHCPKYRTKVPGLVAGICAGRFTIDRVLTKMCATWAGAKLSDWTGEYPTALSPYTVFVTGPNAMAPQEPGAMEEPRGSDDGSRPENDPFDAMGAEPPGQLQSPPAYAAAAARAAAGAGDVGSGLSSPLPPASPPAAVPAGGAAAPRRKKSGEPSDLMLAMHQLTHGASRRTDASADVGEASANGHPSAGKGKRSSPPARRPVAPPRPRPIAAADSPASSPTSSRPCGGALSPASCGLSPTTRLLADRLVAGSRARGGGNSSSSSDTASLPPEADSDGSDVSGGMSPRTAQQVDSILNLQGLRQSGLSGSRRRDSPPRPEHDTRHDSSGRHTRPVSDTPASADTLEDSTTQVVLHKQPEEPLGCDWTEDLLLRSVNSSGAGQRHGLQEMIGRRVTHANEQPAQSVPRLRSLTQGQTKVVLRFQRRLPTPGTSPPQSAANSQEIHAVPRPGGGALGALGGRSPVSIPADPTATESQLRAMMRSAPPEEILIQCPTRCTRCSGHYRLQHGRRVNGHVLWKKEAGDSSKPQWSGAVHWLYSTPQGHWGVTDHEADFSKGVSFVFTAGPHSGVMPHNYKPTGQGACSAWQTKGMRDAPEVRVSAVWAPVGAVQTTEGAPM